MRGSQSDVDIAFYNQDGSLLDFCGQTNSPVCQYPGLSDNIASGDAHEFAFIVNNSGQDIKLQIGIGLFTGPVPGLIKYVWYDDYPTNFGFFGIDEFDTHSSTTWGHPNAEGAEAVGAAWWFDTAAWGLPFHPECHTACLNWYSSAVERRFSLMIRDSVYAGQLSDSNPG